MKDESSNSLNFVGRPAEDANALCVSVVAEMKNLELSAADRREIADHVMSSVTRKQIDAYLSNSQRDHCPVIEDSTPPAGRSPRILREAEPRCKISGRSPVPTRVDAPKEQLRIFHTYHGIIQHEAFDCSNNARME